MNKNIFFILLIALLIRLISLNQSLWLDEATTAKVVQSYSYINIITKFSPLDFHPPFYYFLMKFWTSIFGLSEISLRMPSVIFSILAGFVIYKIGSILKNKTVGFWSAAFFLFNPLIVYYSQEARMYMMATFLLSCALYYFIKMLQLKNYDFILFNLFCILSFYTFYGSIFFIFAMFFVLFFKKKYRLFIFSCLFFIIGIIPLIPLLYVQFIHSRQALLVVSHWDLALGKASLKNLFLIPLKFSSGRISFSPKILYYAVSGLWALIIWLFVVKAAGKNKIITFLLVFPLILGFVFSFFSPLLQYFRFLYLIVPMSLLIAFSTVKKRMSYFILAGFVCFTFLYLLFPQFHREDWKSLAKFLVGFRSVYMISPSSDPLTYYAPSIVIKDLRTLEGDELEKQVLVIPYTADIYGLDYKKGLMEHGFTYKETKTFRGVWYEIWVLRR